MAKPKRFKMTKDGFLDALRRGDKSIGQIVREHGYTSASTVHEWRRRDEKFSAAVEAILATPVHQLRLRHESGTVEERKDPKSKFLYWYQRELDRDGACTYAGVEPVELTSWLDPGCEQYDQAFAFTWQQLQTRRRWKIEDDATKAAIAGSENMQRFLLPVEIPEKYGKMRAAMNVEKVSIFNAGSLANAAAFLTGLFTVNTTEDDSSVPEVRVGVERIATREGVASHVAALSP